MEKLSFPIEKLKEPFATHLDDVENYRIIFSGPFGVGKTYFLNEYFDKNEEYLCVKLAPVNYSVSSNEDIFKLIKYDILLELITLGSRNIVGDVIAPNIFYSVKGPHILNNFLRSLADIVPKLNKSLEIGILIANAFKKAVEELKKAESERLDKNHIHKEADTFSTSIELLPILEEDSITRYIQDVLNQLAYSNEDADKETSIKRKTKVLVIDDLDRIDPEHIFRLFNIFSAHFDYRGRKKQQ